MNSIDVTSAGELNLDRLESLLADGFDEVQVPPGQITVIQDWPGSAVFIYHLWTPAGGTRTNWLCLDYTGGIDLVKRVVERIADDPSLLVSNEFGTVLPGDEFVRRIRSEPDWDWRKTERRSMLRGSVLGDLASMVVSGPAWDWRADFDRGIGAVLSGDEHVQRIKADRDWDWRTRDRSLSPQETVLLDLARMVVADPAWDWRTELALLIVLAERENPGPK